MDNLLHGREQAPRHNYGDRMRVTKKYSTSPLAKLREAAGMTQTAAAEALGYRWKQHLSHIECGRVMASGAILRKMVAVYGVSERRALVAAVRTFEGGVMMRRHASRKRRLRDTAKPKDEG